jgi:hypothetical protein
MSTWSALESDEVPAQFLDRGEIEAWRKLYHLAAAPVRKERRCDGESCGSARRRTLRDAGAAADALRRVEGLVGDRLRHRGRVCPGRRSWVRRRPAGESRSHGWRRFLYPLQTRGTYGQGSAMLTYLSERRSIETKSRSERGQRLRPSTSRLTYFAFARIKKFDVDSDVGRTRHS